MGLFTRKKQPWERDWSDGEIASQHQRHPDASDLQALFDRIRESNSDAGAEKAGVGLLNLFTAQSQMYANDLPGFDLDALTEAQDAIIRRDDFTLAMLVDSLSYFGPQGTAIARKMLHEDLLNWEPVLMTIAAEASGEAAEVPVAPLPESLRESLVQNGMEPLGEAFFRGTFNASDGRTQVLLFGEWDSECFALLSPVGDSADGTVPVSLLELDLGAYSLEVVESIVMLVDLLPARPTAPSFQTIADRGMPLIELADSIERQLSSEDKY